jgi:alkylation response protein AidB-like acyl-CoA dehydrogenase
MEFGFTEEQEKLRKEVRDFYLGAFPEDYPVGGAGTSEEQQAFWLQLQRKAGEKGYLTPGWPKEYGGLGLSQIEQGIFAEEEGVMIRGMSWPNFIGIHLAGPALFMFGTEEQKKEFLPAIARGDTIWLQLFTEPEAGSDEANQQTRAVEDGDYFILNGQKIFISGEYKPDWLYTLARTADTTPKHRGITLFMVPADTPGITYRPQPGGFGYSTQNTIFFDDVRVHKKYMLGELNRGFYHAMSTFEFERGGTRWMGGARQSMRELVQYCKEETRNGKPLFDDPEVRETLAKQVVDIEVWRLIAWRSVWQFSVRETMGAAPYDLTGYYWKHIGLNRENAEDQMRIMGLYGQLRSRSKWAKFNGRILGSWSAARLGHGGGTPEIQKNVLAVRGLGLPRIPPKLNTMIMEELEK